MRNTTTIRKLCAILAPLLLTGLSACTSVATGTGRTTAAPTASENTVDTVVQVTGGAISGSVINGVSQYLGVPYAEADRLFEPAHEVTHWDGVRAATEYGPVSYQSGNMGSSLTQASENESNNCQNLNIWTPATDNAMRPVMVWLHGGGFSTGSANEDEYNGAALAASQNVVVVGVNHRLGVYGFLNLSQYGEEYRQSANVGMLDIVDALKWIQDNIASFGGDPGNVTLFGQSGGGAKVLALMGSPYASGLFERGIMQSGATDTMGATFTSNDVSLAIAAETLQNLGISKDNIEAIQDVSYGDLQQAADKARADIAQAYKVPAMFGGYEYLWEPVVDGDFLPEEPVQEQGFSPVAKEYPLLIGSNLTEWNIWMRDALRHEASDELTATYAKAYPNEDPAGAVDVDMLLRLPLLKITAHKADQYTQDGGASVYSYVFTKQDEQQSVNHGAELPYVFDHSIYDPELARTVSSLWASFARDGAPSAQGVPQWEPYTRENGSVMIIDDETYLAHHHDEPLIELLAPTYNW